jgi:hypothetical protein
MGLRKPRRRVINTTGFLGGPMVWVPHILYCSSLTECKYLTFHACDSLELYDLSLSANRCSLFIAKPIALCTHGNSCASMASLRVSQC